MFIEGNNKELILDESLVVIQDSNIYLKNSIYVLELQRFFFFSGYNGTVIYGSTTVKFEPGYWTFHLIIKKLEMLNVNLTSNANEHNNTCTVTTNVNLQLKKFGELLGFDNNTTINS